MLKTTDFTKWVEVTEIDQFDPTEIDTRQPKIDYRGLVKQRTKEIHLHLIDIMGVPMEVCDLLEIHGRVHRVKFVPKVSVCPILPIVYPTKITRKYRTLFQNMTTLAQLPNQWGWSHDWKWWTKETQKTIKHLVVYFNDTLTAKEMESYHGWLTDVLVTHD